MGASTSACLEPQVLPYKVAYPSKAYKIGDKYCSIYSCIGNNIDATKQTNACYNNGEFKPVGRCNIGKCCYNLNNNGIAYYLGDCLSTGTCLLKNGGDSVICEFTEYKGDNLTCALKSTLNQLVYGHAYSVDDGLYVTCNPDYIVGGKNYNETLINFCSSPINFINEACIKFNKIGMIPKGVKNVNNNYLFIIMLLILVIIIVLINGAKRI